MPYAHVKGLLIGSLTVELGGVVNIKCEKTGYNAELEFKLKPFWKKSGECNYVSGKIRMGNDMLSKIEGKWDTEITITEFSKEGQNVVDPLPELFFEPTPEVKQSRLKRFNVEFASQEENESEKMWSKVAVAIKDADQETATKEKRVLEDEQRRLHRELKEKEEEWVPRLFERDSTSTNLHAWVYKYRDLRPWDAHTDLLAYENQGIIKTRTRIKVPAVQRSSSVVNLPSAVQSKETTSSPRLPSIVEPIDMEPRRDSFDRSSMVTTNSEEEEFSKESIKSSDGVLLKRMLQQSLIPFTEAHKETQKQLHSIRLELNKINQHNEDSNIFQTRDWVLIVFLVLIQIVLYKIL